MTPTPNTELTAQELLIIAVNKAEEELEELERHRRQMLQRHKEELFRVEAQIMKKRRQLRDGQACLDSEPEMRESA